MEATVGSLVGLLSNITACLHKDHLSIEIAVGRPMYIFSDIDTLFY